MKISIRIGLVVGFALGLMLLVGRSAIIGQGGAGLSSSPTDCRQCHRGVYWQWVDSSHNTSAFASETFQAVWERERQSPDCLRCHATGYDPDTSTVDYEGVGCRGCHRLLAEEGDDYYDPQERDHAPMSIPDRAEECSGCHGTEHALTFVEWEASAHNEGIEVGCLSCHDAHGAGLVLEDTTDLCGSCHFQPVPTTSEHMDIDSGCTDCHPEPVSVDNVHMHGGNEAEASCIECHMVTETDRWGRYLTNAGHTMEVSLTACVNCHGELHTLQPSVSQPAMDTVCIP